LVEQLLTTAGAKGLRVFVEVDVFHEFLLVLWVQGIEVDVVHRSITTSRHVCDAVEEFVKDGIFSGVLIRQLFDDWLSRGSAQIRL